MEESKTEHKSDSGAEDDYLWRRHHAASYRVRLSIGYYRKRERFFDVCDRVTKCGSVLLAMGAISSILVDANWKLGATALIAVGNALSLVFGFSERARKYADLARQGCELDADICAKGHRDFLEADLNGWDAKMARLEAGEPPTLTALVAKVQNEIAIAGGHPPPAKLSFIQSALAQFFDFQVARADADELPVK